MYHFHPPSPKSKPAAFHKTTCFLLTLTTLRKGTNTSNALRSKLQQKPQNLLLIPEHQQPMTFLKLEIWKLCRL